MQELAKWQPGYSVFVRELDEHHKKLIDLLNELYDAYLQDVHKDKVGEIIIQLKQYALNHFDLEETYFKQFSFENTSEHVKEHAFFLQKLTSFEKEYMKSSTLTSLRIINFLQEWVTNHILITDKKYVSCFVKNGLK